MMLGRAPSQEGALPALQGTGLWARCANVSYIVGLLLHDRTRAPQSSQWEVRRTKFSNVK